MDMISLVGLDVLIRKKNPTEYGIPHRHLILSCDCWDYLSILTISPPRVDAQKVYREMRSNFYLGRARIMHMICNHIKSICKQFNHQYILYTYHG